MPIGELVGLDELMSNHGPRGKRIGPGLTRG